MTAVHQAGVVSIISFALPNARMGIIQLNKDQTNNRISKKGVNQLCYKYTHLEQHFVSGLWNIRYR